MEFVTRIMASSGKNESTPKAKEDTIPSLTREAANLKEKLEEERRILNDVERKAASVQNTGPNVRLGQY